MVRAHANSPGEGEREGMRGRERQRNRDRDRDRDTETECLIRGHPHLLPSERRRADCPTDQPAEDSDAAKVPPATGNESEDTQRGGGGEPGPGVQVLTVADSCTSGFPLLHQAPRPFPCAPVGGRGGKI